MALHPLSSHRRSRSLLPGYTEHVHTGALLTATWGLGEKGALGGKESSYSTANREARKRPVCWDGSPGGRRKLLESRIWLTGSDGTQEWSLTSLGSPSWCSPMHIPHPEVLLYESNSCLNADTDVISICVFFENNAFQKQYDSSQ